MLTYSEWIELINFISHMLYMYVSFMCGILLGYVIGFRNGSM